MHTHIINSAKYGRVLVHLDDCDADLLEGVTWGARFVRGGIPHCITRQNKRSAILLHREIILRVFPSFKFTKEICVDHRNGNPFDNQRANLRICSYLENSRNRRSSVRSTGNYPGVHFVASSGRFRAVIKVGGRLKHIGCYLTIDEAIVARKAAEAEHFGEFAFSNRLLTSTN
jgi:hypothetical protein